MQKSDRQRTKQETRKEYSGHKIEKGHKNYVIDTNVLLDDPEAILKLSESKMNSVYIPRHVILELDKLKKSVRVGHIVAKVVEIMKDFPDCYSILESKNISPVFLDRIDQYILDEIKDNQIESPILVSNDNIMRLFASVEGLKSEEYKESAPFKSEAEHITGIVKIENEVYPNCFMWGANGKPIFFSHEGSKMLDYQHKIWNITPRNVYQNMALELMADPLINIVSIQSEAGYGKSYLALAMALCLLLEKKSVEKIYVVKPMIEIGQKLGYLPGDVEEKMAPYTRYIVDLLLKLHKIRPANRIFIDAEKHPPQLNPMRFELLPLTYIRGMNIENAVVIIDEMQNMTRGECRTLLSRMGEGVKCFCLGDTRQVDHPYLNQENNGLNWVVRKFKGQPSYGHIVLNGQKSRGPITDLVIKTGL